MKRQLRLMLLWAALLAAPVWAGETHELIYWDSPTGRVLRARIADEADYWQLIPHFTAQQTQSYCSVASAVTVLNALPIDKPVDPAYAPYGYFTQHNYFTPAVADVISARTVLSMGMTREEMARTLTLHGVHSRSIAGDSLSEQALRSLLEAALLDDGRFVLVNYLRASLKQVGSGHWSALAAYDRESDRVLILDVAKYKYPPVWLSVRMLREAMATRDASSGQARGLVIVSK